MPHVVFYKRLSINQRGNKKWHSTETSLIHTTDAIIGAVNQKKTTAVVLLDMRKAFDSINHMHDIFLDKLQDVGASASGGFLTICLEEAKSCVLIPHSRMRCH